MDGNQFCLVPLCGEKQMLYWKAAQRLEKGRFAQPRLPWGSPCLRRQDPSSVSKAIFTNAWKLLLLSLRLSCEGTKRRQIPSLGTQQALLLPVLQSCLRHRLDFGKCLPPCFLLSSPFWSPFFGCSLGLWGCCKIKTQVNIIKKIKYLHFECCSEPVRAFLGP